MAWQDELRPASFRGVPFYVQERAGAGGRRIVTHEFPRRDTPFTEDLGKAALTYRVRAYLLGDSYIEQRNALLAALLNYATPGQLVLPTDPPLSARAGRVQWQEAKEIGGQAFVEIEFVRDGPQPSPTLANSTASGLLAGLTTLAPILVNAYALGAAIAANPRLLLGVAGTLLGSAVSGFLGIAPTTIAGLSALIGAITENVSDPTGTANAVVAAFSAASDNVATAADTALTLDDPVAGTLPVLPFSTDPSGGLAGLASWGSNLVAPSDPQIAATQAAIVSLIQGAATMAVAQSYAQLAWPTANAATAARAQLASLIGTQVDAASAAGNADLYRAWRAIAALATAYFVTEAQQLPVLQPYAIGASLPSLALAQRLVQDASQAPVLVALNGAIHPLFMPASGVSLPRAA